MPEVDSTTEVFLCNFVHTPDVRFRRGCQAPANLRAEAEEVFAPVGIAGHARTLADHKPNINLFRVVGICRHIQNFTIRPSSFLVIDVVICV